MSALDVAAYLDRLGVRVPGEPTVESLHALHRAHVERVPYENLEIQLGRPTTVDPVESAERIVARGRGGYCYHLNGAFSALLVALGYRVKRHLGGVQRTEHDSPRISGGHMVVTVHGLPHDSCPSGTWLVDVGLGAALHEPLPLHEGAYRQGPFEYRLLRSGVEPDAWRFHHDARIGISGMDFRMAAASLDEFASMHKYLSTAPDSPFVRVVIVQRRHATGANVLRGLVLTQLDGSSSTTTIESPREWFSALAEVFRLELVDIDASDRERLWRRVQAAHAEYVAADA